MENQIFTLNYYVKLDRDNIYNNWWQNIIIQHNIFSIIRDIETISEGFKKVFSKSESRNTYISKNAVIGDNVYIGNNCKIYDFAIVRDHSIIMDNVIIGHGSEIARSILFSGTNISHKATASDCIIGENVNIGAVVTMATASIYNSDFSLIEKSIKIKMPNGQKFDTNMNKLGSVIGSDSRIGSNVCLNPGTLLSSGCIVYPGVVLPSNVYLRNTIVKLKQSLELVINKSDNL